MAPADAQPLALAGRSAVVTGASRGIGLAIARVLVAAGARVAMLARGRETLERRAAELGNLAVAVPCDVADRATVEIACDIVRERFGRAPDLLVNNAGLFAIAPVDGTSPDLFTKSLDVNLVAPFLLVRAFAGEMRARGDGHIVTIGSIADRVAMPGNAAYAASKFGARAMHQVVREELRGSGVRATLVSPGPVDTAMWDDIDPDTRPGFTPRARMLQPEAVADAVLYVVTRPADVNVDELRLSRA